MIFKDISDSESEDLPELFKQLIDANICNDIAEIGIRLYGPFIDCMIVIAKIEKN